MPARIVVTEELAKIFGVLSHPHRVRIIEELRHGERDVNTLQDALGVSHSRVSQHLSRLRSHRLVVERREGRHVFYRLTQPHLARWLLEGLQFIEGRIERADRIRDAVQQVRHLWLDDADGDSKPNGKTNGKPNGKTNGKPNGKSNGKSNGKPNGASTSHRSSVDAPS